MSKKKISININGEELKKKLKIRDGKDGKDAVVDVTSIVDTTKSLVEESIKPLIPAPFDVKTVKPYIESLEDEERIDKTAIKGIEDLEKDIDDLKKKPIGKGGGLRGFNLLVDDVDKGIIQYLDIEAGNNITLAHSAIGEKQIVTINATVDPETQDLQAVTDLGATTTNTITLPSLQFDTTAGITVGEGELAWNATDETLDLGMPDGINLQIGQETQLKARNNTGSTILNGRPVYQSGMLGNRPTIALAQGNSNLTGRVLGLTTQDISNNADGKVTTFGYVRNIDTTGTPFGETWSDGDTLWVSKDIAGYLTNVEPAAAHYSDIVGQVVNAHATQGSILVNIAHHSSLEHLSDVDGIPLDTTGQFPVWDNDNGYFDFNYNINDYLLASSFVPGGSTTQLQYNNAGSFGGISTMWFDNVNNRISIGNAAFPTDSSLLLIKAVSPYTNGLHIVTDAGATLLRTARGGPVYVKDQINNSGNGSLISFGGISGSSLGTIRFFPAGTLRISMLQNGDSIWNSVSSFSSGEFVAIKVTPTITQSGTAAAIDLMVDRTQTSVGSGLQAFQDFRLSGTSQYTITTAGKVGYLNNAPTAYLHLRAGSTSATTAPIKFESGSLMTTPENGAMEYNGDKYTLSLFGVRKTISLSGDTQTTDTTVSNTTTETTVKTFSVIANELKAGKLYKATILGKFSTANASDTFTLRFKIGGTTIISTVLDAKNVTDEHFRCEFYTTIRTTGASGTYAANLEATLGSQVATATPVTGTVDTTVAEDITATVQWSNALSGNTLTVMQSLLEILN